eukprot:gene23980-16300_t
MFRQRIQHLHTGQRQRCGNASSNRGSGGGVQQNSASMGLAAEAAAAEANVVLPEAWQLRRHALLAAIPYVGFGFMDNMVMIMAGDYIDGKI